MVFRPIQTFKTNMYQYPVLSIVIVTIGLFMLKFHKETLLNGINHIKLLSLKTLGHTIRRMT